MKKHDLLSNVDISGAQDYNDFVKNPNGEDFYNKSGLKYIKYLIESHFGSVSNNFFFEYSIIASIIDNTSKQLTSFALYKTSIPKKQQFTTQLADAIAELQNYNSSIFFHENFWIKPRFRKKEYELSIIDNKNHFLSKANSRRERTLLKNYNNRAVSAHLCSNFKVVNTTTLVNNLSYPFKMADMYAKSREIQISTKRANELMHIMYHNNIYNKNKQTCLVSFPLIACQSSNNIDLSFNSNSNMQGQGAVFLFLELKRPCSHSVIESKISAFVNDVANSIRFFSYNYLFNVGLQLQNAARKESIKSAKAAIMARNISHNLGSHVMAYLKNKLGSVSDIIKQRVLADLTYSDSMSDLAKKIKKYENNNAGFSESVELPFLVGLGHFLSYLQEREDYIATVATSYIPHLMSVNFKDAIYDMLNPDLRHLRHSSRKGGKPDNILLSYIAKSEGFERPAYLNYEIESDVEKLEALDQSKREGDIVIKFGDFDGINDITYKTAEFMKDGKSTSIQVRGDDIKCKGAGAESLAEMRKYNIGLPGGITGRQAIFSILENVIRNSAKHGVFYSGGADVKNKKLVLTLDIYDLNDSDIESYLRSDLKELHLFLDHHNYYAAYDKEYTYVMTITDSSLIEQKKFEKLEAALSYDYLNEKGEMDGRAKGLKEMRISAAWLRRIVDEDEVHRKNMAPIIKARFISQGTDKKGNSIGNLQYIICLPKAFSVAIVKNDIRGLSSTDKIKYMSVDQLNNLRDRSFDIIATENSLRNCLYLKTPNRIISMRDTDLDAINEENVDDLYKKRIRGCEDCIYLYDKREYFQKSSYSKVENKLDNAKDRSLYHNKYLYKHHLESEGEFRQFIKMLSSASCDNGAKPRPLFAEGISGGNSTDRIVRNDVHDSRWYYKHLHAMQCKIAIFDERLFHNNTGLDDEDLSFVQSESIAGDYLAVVNAFKNVYIFNVIYNPSEDCDWFDIFGYDDYKIDENGEVYSTIKWLGKIYRSEDENQRLLIDIDERYRNQFNNLSIHQGLLDKIYRKWGLEAVVCEKNNKVDFSNQEMVTMVLYNTILRQDKDDTENTSQKMTLVDFTDKDKLTSKRWYYPNMTIHSGRSKPSELDMPQLMPFIQYASIENALMDCKYSLVELLELSQYE